VANAVIRVVIHSFINLFVVASRCEPQSRPIHADITRADRYQPDRNDSGRSKRPARLRK
jgi:hypothetical protein